MDKSILEWDDIEYEAERIWKGKPELIWAKKAWSGITKQGLAFYVNDIEKHLVLIRLLTLATIYREFYYISFDESFDLETEYYDWIENMEISPFRIGQIVGNDFEIDLEDYENELMSIAVFHLIEENKYDVFNAITKEFGDKHMLFVWLWITVGHSDLVNQYENKDVEVIYDENYDIKSIAEFADNGNNLELYERIIEDNFYFIFNDDITPNKLIAYNWVDAKGML